MKLDDLKQIWREEMNTEITTGMSYEKIVADVKEIDRGALFARNTIICLTIAVILLFCFVGFFVKPDLNLVQRGSMVAMAVLFVYFSTVLTQSLRTGTEENWTLSARLNIEIMKIENQVSMSKSMPIRFVLPMFIIVIVMSFSGYYSRTGSLVPDADLVIYYALCIVIFVGTAWLYLHTERTKLTPILNKLTDLRRQLSSD